MTTTATEVPRDRWNFFFDAFSRQHLRWIASAEVAGPDAGARVEVAGLPFMGISADLTGRGDFVSLALGEAADAHVTHTIAAPTRVVLERSDYGWGGSEVLVVEAADGVKVRLQFQSLVLPEMLDGLV